jgi:hypothetical protein
MADPLSWRNVSTAQLRDFIGSDGDWKVARIMLPLGKGDWRWSVFAIIPAHADIHGHEAEPKEARHKVEAAWARAKAEGVRKGNHIQLDAAPSSFSRLYMKKPVLTDGAYPKLMQDSCRAITV